MFIKNGLACITFRHGSSYGIAGYFGQFYHFLINGPFDVGFHQRLLEINRRHISQLSLQGDAFEDGVGMRLQPHRRLHEDAIEILVGEHVDEALPVFLHLFVDVLVDARDRRRMDQRDDVTMALD